MKIKDVEMGKLYAVNYGSGIERGRAVRMKRTNITNMPGIIMDLERRVPEGQRCEVWIAGQFVREPWEDYLARLQEQHDAEQALYTELTRLQRTLAESLKRNGVETPVRIHNGALQLRLADLDDIKLLVWALNAPPNLQKGQR